MNIRNMASNSLMTNYLSSMNKSESLFGATKKKNSTMLDFASINTQKMQKMLSYRAEKEAAAAQEMTQFRDSTKSFYSDFYPKMSDLSSAASKLKSTTMESVLKPIGYGSDNSNVAANVSGTIASGEKVELEVSQVASGQTNTFAAMDSAAKDLVGKTTVDLEIGGKKTSVSMDIAAGTTNESALKQVADKLNAEKTGVTASVSVKDGKAQLQLSSDKIGEASAFKATVTGAGAKPMGEATISAAQNAKYTVNGKEFTSDTNTVKLMDNRLSATLTGTGKANLSKDNIDPGNAVYAVKDFAKKYNDVVNFLNKNTDKSVGVKTMASSFSNTRFMSNSLSKVGIDVDTSGRLTVNEDRLTAALKEDPSAVNSIIGGSNGLAGQASQKASSAIGASTRLFQTPRSFDRFYGTPVGVLMDYRA